MFYSAFIDSYKILDLSKIIQFIFIYESLFKLIFISFYFVIVVNIDTEKLVLLKIDLFITGKDFYVTFH